MSAAERDFSTFVLGDNVYELSEGLIPEIAEALEVPLSSEPSSEDLQVLMGKVGQNKVLRENHEVTAIDRDQTIEFVERAGVQRALNRSLWTPDVPATSATVDAVVGMGGVANWQDRFVGIAEGVEVPVYYAAGSRTMDTATERPNANVARIHDALGRYPSEMEYAAAIVFPRLAAMGRSAIISAKLTENGDQLLTNLLEQHPRLLEQRIAVARVANAGVLMATQVRAAARAIDPSFDRDTTDPQLFVLTDSFPLARTPEQEGDSAHYQKAGNALRQVVLTAKKLHAAALEG